MPLLFHNKIKHLPTSEVDKVIKIPILNLRFCRTNATELHFLWEGVLSEFVFHRVFRLL